MPVALRNYLFSRPTDKGKLYFVPTEKCREIGAEVMALVAERVEFEPHYYHFSKGAHVSALHAHRAHHYFARLDLKNFFYSVGRNSVKAALKSISVPYPEHFARWSSVKNPYEGPSYALPYGFSQSPILASLVLRQSALGTAIRDLPSHIRRSVYLDDIAISADDPDEVGKAFEVLKAAVVAANFSLNDDKVFGPATSVSLFNCDLERGLSKVSDPRVAKFYAAGVSEASAAAFESYRDIVATGNQ